jgi:hypothetical protein
MRANVIICLLAGGLLGCLVALDLRSGIPSQEKLSPGNEVSTNDEVVGPDAYKVAVLVSVGLAILSLCF